MTVNEKLHRQIAIVQTSQAFFLTVRDAQRRRSGLLYGCEVS